MSAKVEILGQVNKSGKAVVSCKTFKELIKGKLIHSMNRPGHCPDNSPIESFWGILKAELYYNLNVRRYLEQSYLLKMQ